MSDIHIKKSHEGKFTDYCGGKVTDECIKKGKNSPSAKVRKMATFASNARRWKHAEGGIMKMSMGKSIYDRSGGIYGKYGTSENENSIKAVKPKDIVVEEYEPQISEPTSAFSGSSTSTSADSFNAGWDAIEKAYDESHAGTSTVPVTSTTNTTSTVSSGSGPRGIRNHNWFNIRGTKTVWDGQESDFDDKGFVRFKNAEYGVRAARKNLNNYFKGGYNTINKIVNRWSPVADPGNSAAGVNNYVNFVAKTAGIDKDAVIDPNDDELMSKIMYGMALFENGKNSPIDMEVIKRGIQLAKG